MCDKCSKQKKERVPKWFYPKYTRFNTIEVIKNSGGPDYEYQECSRSQRDYDELIDHLRSFSWVWGKEMCTDFLEGIVDDFVWGF